MSGETNSPCQVKLSTIFVFESPQFQTAANTVYEKKKAYDAAQAAAGKNTVYTFKTDYERMQYKLGLFGRFSTGQR
jgi:hypothetical protein